MTLPISEQDAANMIAHWRRLADLHRRTGSREAERLDRLASQMEAIVASGSLRVTRTQSIAVRKRAEPAPLLLKECNVCKEILPIGRFARNNANSDGYQRTCRHCAKQATRHTGTEIVVS